MKDRSSEDYEARARVLWSGFSANERRLITIGIFPDDAMKVAEAEGFSIGTLAVSLMRLQRVADRPRFRLGQIVATPGALHLFERAKTSAHRFLARHVHGDWGDLDDEDKRSNDAAVTQDTRILSAYQVGDEKLWVITEADRSSTCLLLPSEY